MGSWMMPTVFEQFRPQLPHMHPSGVSGMRGTPGPRAMFHRAVEVVEGVADGDGAGVPVRDWDWDGDTVTGAGDGELVGEDGGDDGDEGAEVKEEDGDRGARGGEVEGDTGGVVEGEGAGTDGEAVPLAGPLPRDHVKA